MEKKVILVKVISAYKQDPSRPRPKWWDNFVGEIFECYDNGNSGGYCWTLSIVGLEKLSQLRDGKKSFRAIIHKCCGEVLVGSRDITLSFTSKINSFDPCLYSDVNSLKEKVNTAMWVVRNAKASIERSYGEGAPRRLQMFSIADEFVEQIKSQLSEEEIEQFGEKIFRL